MTTILGLAAGPEAGGRATTAVAGILAGAADEGARTELLERQPRLGTGRPHGCRPLLPCPGSTATAGLISTATREQSGSRSDRPAPHGVRRSPVGPRLAPPSRHRVTSVDAAASRDDVAGDTGDAVAHVGTGAGPGTGVDGVAAGGEGHRPLVALVPAAEVGDGDTAPPSARLILTAIRCHLARQAVTGAGGPPPRGTGRR